MGEGEEKMMLLNIIPYIAWASETSVKGPYTFQEAFLHSRRVVGMLGLRGKT